MTKKTLFGIAAGVAFLHFIATFSCMIYVLGDRMERFDNPQLPENRSVHIVDQMTEVLMLPAVLLWTSRASKHVPNLFENLFFLLNSGVWGLAVAFLLKLVSPRSTQA